ncbi:MAG: hypothetical protein ACRED9_07985 [Caulobacteraceae bacterium]
MSAPGSVLGRWRIAELPGNEDDYADMVEPAYVLFETAGGEFAFGCVTGAGDYEPSSSTGTATMRWNKPAALDGPNFSPDASLQGEICFNGGGEIAVNAHRWPTSSTACL